MGAMRDDLEIHSQCSDFGHDYYTETLLTLRKL